MTHHWQSVLKENYGIDAELSKLDGEYDLNFMATQSDGEQCILKVMRAGCEDALVDMQCKAINHVANLAPNSPLPRVIKTNQDTSHVRVSDESGEVRIIWLLSKLSGISYASFKPHSQALIQSLGHELGLLSNALDSFVHPYLDREFKWDLGQAEWISDHIDAIHHPARQILIKDIATRFMDIKPILSTLPKVAVHNDANDYNILVSNTAEGAGIITGIIDFGDMVRTQRICDLAIAAAYVVLGHNNPERALAALVSGYHSAYPLSTQEIDLLYPLIRMRLAVSVVNSTIMAAQNPNDPYITISQTPAWDFLETFDVNETIISARLRTACKLPVTNNEPDIMAYLAAERGNFAPLFGKSLANAPTGPLSVSQSTTPINPFDLASEEAARVGSEFDNGDQPWLGFYGEPRLIYTADAFYNGPYKASDRRTVHLAIDVFAPAQTPLYAPLAGTVVAIADRNQHLDYGGVVILEHSTPKGDNFYTLYGHLNPEIMDNLKIGDHIPKGRAFCKLGDNTQNGGWSPHVHFQMGLTMAGMGDDWPGVSDPDDRDLWLSLFPNPAALLNLNDETALYKALNQNEIKNSRQEHFAPNLKLSYQEPVMFMRGWKHHLFDEYGRPHLDAYNNVPHVGHAHPRIQAVAADQLLRMNSNTRYLHPAQTEFAQTILKHMPNGMSVCYFVNSGTEANELALRLARAHTGEKDMITPDHGYHGNTTGAIDISAYKFNKTNGVGQADWVHLIDVADDYQGQFRRDDPMRAQKYADLVDIALSKITAKNGKLAGFIAETFPSVGGQIIPPAGYLKAVYEKIRAAGGIAIADEVQTALGRLGDYYFGFEHQNVIPDIVVMGKPIGNGHPLGVVVTTPEIAASFANGIEFFSTFGGSTLSCRIGKEVLDIIEDEGLQQNALEMGNLLLSGLHDLSQKHQIIGDIRGMGLFVGVELVTDRETQTPATWAADYVVNRMREERILMGTEGPHDNILKIRPPLTIEKSDVDMIVATLDKILSETALN
jgi:4-aminobutyrate aminotransferase-like enzyme/Ser/Thr protein kinase RdoA (MazF antagonist)